MPRTTTHPLLVLALSACTAADPDSTVETDSAVDSDTDVPEPATARWMAEVFEGREDTPLNRILIPGGFNSSSYACAAQHGMSPDAPAIVQAMWGNDEDTPNDHPNRQLVVDWAKTQNHSLLRQLRDGNRFLKINLTVKDGEILTWHSVYGLPVGDMLDQIVTFAIDHPDEVVVLSMGAPGPESVWADLTEELLAPRTDGVSLCDVIHTSSEDAALATLGEIQADERPIVWAPDGDFRAYLDARGDCPTSTMAVDRTWSITDSTEGVEDALADSVDSRDPDRLLINDFVFSLGGAENALVQASYLAEYSGQQEAQTALGFAGDYAGELIERFDADGNLNVFVGAFYEDTNLIEAAIARNRDLDR